MVVLKMAIILLECQKVIVKGNEARLENGVIAGSVLSLNKMVFNFLDNTNLKVNKAINLASLNPATSLGINDKKKLRNR